MKIEEVLGELGLSGNDARVYVVCFQFPRSSISTIARVSGLPRSTVHDIVQRLLQEGYVTQESNGKRHLYTAVEPEVISGMLFFAKKSIDEKLAMVHEHQHAWEQLRVGSVNVPQVTYHTTSDVIGVLYNRLRNSREIVGYFDIDAVVATSHYSLDDLVGNIVTSSVMSKELVPDSPTGRAYRERVDTEQHQVKLLSDPVFADTFSDHIIMDDSYFYIWYEPQRVVGIEITHPGFVNLQRALFLGLWDSSA